MSRLTEREIAEIRRVKRAVHQVARDEVSQVYLADGAPSRHSTPYADFATTVARQSGLAEIGWIVRQKIAAPVLRAIRVRRAIRELESMSDALLRDIGIDRNRIEETVRGVVGESTPETRPATGPFAALRRWRSQRHTINELSRLNDRVLEDIGILRSEIPGLVARIHKTPTDGRVQGQIPARTTSPLHSVQQWNLSRQAADDMARFDSEALADLGYVKGDIGETSERLAARKFAAG
jgi:uncharacterized protein YjiS (DUF1127 family)